MTTATATTGNLDSTPVAKRQVAITWIGEISDRNGSIMYPTQDGRLTREIDEAERFVTREMAELMASPAMNGIPSSNIARLEIRGTAVPVEWA